MAAGKLVVTLLALAAVASFAFPTGDVYDLGEENMDGSGSGSGGDDDSLLLGGPDGDSLPDDSLPAPAAGDDDSVPPPAPAPAPAAGDDDSVPPPAPAPAPGAGLEGRVPHLEGRVDDLEALAN